jgi:predicted nucleotidyltransferase
MSCVAHMSGGGRYANRQGGQVVDVRRALVHLNETERDCVLRYVSLLAERLGENLLQIWLFGSAARGDMWPDFMPMHSDIDLLILSNRPVPQEVQEELVNDTYLLFLECGRQISPQFRTMAQYHSPGDERAREFVARVRSEGYLIYEHD